MGDLPVQRWPGGEGVLTVEDWAEIRRLHRAEGMPIKAIVRTLGIARNTVRAALASEAPPKYQRKSAGSAVDAVEPRIREPRPPSLPDGRHRPRRYARLINEQKLSGVL
jgi:transposase